MGRFPPSFGNLYILLAVDYVSKWVEAIPCPKINANTVVGFLQRNILSRFGALRTIISYKGSHFANKMFAKLLSRYGVRHVMRLAYHPQSNEQAEISNREIKNTLEKTVNASRKDWSIKLDDACGRIELLISPLLECPHTRLYLESIVIYLWSLNIKQCGRSKS